MNEGMKSRPKTFCLLTGLAVLLSNAGLAKTEPFAIRVVDYRPGEEIAVEFGSGLPFDLAAAALGAPSKVNPGEFGGPIDPFSPPFMRDQLLSLGAGGYVVLELGELVFDHPGNPFGKDLNVFGSSGFQITNGDFSGGGVTDGSLFGANAGDSRVSVSSDGETFYTLEDSVLRGIDNYYPTDGSGNPHSVVNPEWRVSDGDDLGLASIRRYYEGAAGGAGYDLASAIDAEGNSVVLESARYVRIDVLNGRAEIDAVAVVSPDSKAFHGPIRETFESDPLSRGWRMEGDANLFRWREQEQDLEITWDSSKPNSYYFLPLPSGLTEKGDFRLSFDLRLETIAIGTTEGKPFTFPIAIGLFNREEATRDDFFRGSGIHADYGPRGLVEWSYLPDSGFGATVSTGLISNDNQWAFSNTFPLEMKVRKDYHIDLDYDALDGVLRTVMTQDGELFGPIQDARLDNFFGPAGFDAFSSLQADMLAIASYSDGGQSPPEFAGSIQAKGWVDNVVLTTSQAPALTLERGEDGRCLVEFDGREGLSYWLEGSSNLKDWFTVDRLRGTSHGRPYFSLDSVQDGNRFFRVRETP